MRHTRTYLAIAFAALLLPSTASAFDINVQNGPFTFFTWPFQVLWQILSAPVEMAQGGIKSANVLVMPADRQIPPLEKWKMPKITMPKLPAWLLDKDPESTPPTYPAKTAAKPATSVAPVKTVAAVPPSAKTGAQD